jgi:hypothetical protein
MQKSNPELPYGKNFLIKVENLSFIVEIQLKISAQYAIMQLSCKNKMVSCKNSLYQTHKSCVIM